MTKKELNKAATSFVRDQLEIMKKHGQSVNLTDERYAQILQAAQRTLKRMASTQREPHSNGISR